MTCRGHSTARGRGHTPEPLSSKEAWHKGPCPPSARGHPCTPSALHLCRVNAPSVIPAPGLCTCCHLTLFLLQRPFPEEPPQAAPLHIALPMNSGRLGPSACTLSTCAPVPCTPAHLAPGPHCPLCAGLRVAGLCAAGSQRLLAQAWLWAGHQTLLFAAATSLGALGVGGQAGQATAGSEDAPPPTPYARPHLPPGGGVPAEAGLGSAVPAGRRLWGPRLAVEGPQWPDVPSVHAQHVPHRDPAAAAAGALGPHRTE